MPRSKNLYEIVFVLSIIIGLFVIVAIGWLFSKFLDWLDWSYKFPRLILSDTVKEILAWIGVVIMFLVIGFCIWSDKCEGF